MENLEILNPPDFTTEIKKVDYEDYITAESENEIKKKLLNNDVFLKHIVDALVKETAEHMADGRIHVTQENKQAWDAKATTEVAAQNRNGLQSAADKTKLDGIAAGAEVNQDAISSVNAGGTIVQSNSKAGQIAILAGSNNVKVTGDNATKQVKIAVSGGNADTLGGRAASELSVQYATTSGSANSVTWGNVSGKPSTFSPASHTHDDRYYTEAETNNLLNGKANSSHNHNGVYSTATNVKNGTGESSVVVGKDCKATAQYAYAAGYMSEASGWASHAEGYATNSTQESAHAEGELNTACGYAAHVEGFQSKASGWVSHAEGQSTKANGEHSHAEGYCTVANGNNSHAGGYYTVANGHCHFAIGCYNLDTQTNPNTMSKLFMIGNGTSGTNRGNAFSVSFTGQVQATGSYNTGGADYAEYLEWFDGNPDKEDRIGYFITLEGEKIKIAKEGDFIVGIISAAPSVIGNSYEEEWCNRYVKDGWGRTQYKDVEVKDGIGDDGTILMPAHQEIQPILNPNYDHTMPYLARSQRPEWDVVGMLGQLVVRDDGTCQVNGYCQVANGGIATAAAGNEEYAIVESQLIKRYRVIARITDNIIKIIFR